MSKKVIVKGDTNKSIVELLRHLLESGEVDAVFTLGKTGDGLNYLFITDPGKLDSAEPLSPYMPANAANLLSELTAVGPMPSKVAAVIRPCELRGFVERVKRQQANRENIVFISPVCSGVLRVDSLAEGRYESELAGYWSAAEKLEDASENRPNCTTCEHFIPYNADITIVIEKGKVAFYTNNDEAEKLLKGAPGEATDGELDKKTFDTINKKRTETREKMFAELGTEQFGIEGLVRTFGKCIGCHGCSSVCPICYCELCTFESRDLEPVPATFDSELAKRGAVRVPPNTILYHLGRLTHMGVSCVGCGMCSDVCPADIPVSQIFTKVGNAIQNVFSYIPGKDYDEEVPLLKFELEELEEVED